MVASGYLTRGLAGILLWLGLASMSLGVTSAGDASRATLPHTTATLSSAQAQLAGDESFWVLFELEIQPGWHTYWQNPGDSGMAPTLRWTLPEGVQADSIVWQPPQRQPFPPLVNYGYSGTAAHLVQIHLPAGGLNVDSLEMRVAANWLVCEVECIPEAAELALTVPVTGQSRSSADAEKIAALRASASHESLPVLRLSATDEQLNLTLPLPAELVPAELVDAALEAYVFPETAGVIEAAAPQAVAIDSSERTLTLTLTRGIAAVPEAFTGLLALNPGHGDDHSSSETRHFQLVPTAAVAASAVNAPSATVPPMAVGSIELGWLLLLAFVGGVILNAMPCVFPVLSLKALALVGHHSATGRADIRAQGWAYTAGVVVSFLVVGGGLLGLKAAGESVGWGFQMQSPLFVALLAWLMALIGFNLSGLFEIRWAYAGGQAMTERSGWFGSFATGVLATAVATPCTAPFMATALGAALVLPAWAALAIFAALGVGLAFPFLLLCLWPRLQSALPRPGAWMLRLRQLLAFPMYLTALWLSWIVGQQLGVTAMAIVLMGVVSLGFTCWVWPLRPGNPLGLSAIVLVIGVLVVAPLRYLWRATPATASADIVAAQDGRLQPAAYDPQRLEKFRAERTPVFVYGTADWCITCKVNEKVALQTDAVRTHFKREGIVVLKADWTRTDPMITAYLAQFGRSGVPIYVFYPPSGEPILLPQLLTPAIIETATSS